jgi:2-phospho-L-lactate guanylyltransferase
MFAVVPIKRFALAKSRLRGLLRDCERSEFAALMAADVLRAVAAAKTVTGIAVVTDDPAAMSLAVSFGGEVLHEPGATGLSHVMGCAFASLRARGIAQLMYLPADVPLVTPTRIDSLTRNRTEGLALVSAQRDGGTNALILNGGATLEFSFGPGSCRRHASRARHAGISVRMLGATEVRCDIDTPDDFISLARSTGRGCQSQQFARDILQRQLGGHRPPESKHDIQSALA